MKVGVFGAGKQGSCVAYDIARNGIDVILFDNSNERLEHATKLSGASGELLDIRSDDSLQSALSKVDVVVGALPYTLHPVLAKAALEAGKHYLDLGIDTPDARELFARQEEVEVKGLVAVPDCGLAPGLVNMLGAAGMQRLDSTERVRLYCGVLPQNRNLPFGYKIAFSLEGLIGEYEDAVHEIQGGEVIEREALDPIDPIYVEGIGALEAFPTSGGAGTSVDLYPGILQEYAYRTLRYPGHAQSMKWLRDVGMWSTEPIPGSDLTPLQVFAGQMEAALSLPDEREIAITLAEAEGVRDGVQMKVRATVIHPQNLGDTFTAMEWLTGIGISIPTIHLCKNGPGEKGLKPGVSQLEVAMHPDAFLAEIERRGVNVVWSEDRVD